jgi:hypothetical protein
MGSRGVFAPCWPEARLDRRGGPAVNTPHRTLCCPCRGAAAAVQEMLCIEPAVAGTGAVTLGPGESWSGKQTITAAS